MRERHDGTFAPIAAAVLDDFVLHDGVGPRRHCCARHDADAGPFGKGPIKSRTCRNFSDDGQRYRLLLASGRDIARTQGESIHRSMIERGDVAVAHHSLGGYAIKRIEQIDFLGLKA